jgi:hypothetical protein
MVITREIAGTLRHREELIWLLPLTVLALLVFATAQAVGMGEGISAAAVLADYGHKLSLVLPAVLTVMLVAALAQALLKRSKSPLRDLAAALRARFGTPVLLLAALAPLLLLPVVIAAYGVLKQLMPLITPFVWDDAFAAADRFLFFGYQPWQLTHSLLGSPAATVAIDWFYTFWVAMLFFTIPGVALFAPRYDRARFILSFAIAWILLGLVGGYLGASAGPCYTALIGAGSAPEFAPLMERLRDISNSYGSFGAVQWQGVLWDAHVNRDYGFAMGVSAMPSLHNAIAVLYALAVGRAGRGWKIAGWSFAFTIFFGSVHLGWHYAVDGIISAAVMLAIWWAVGRYLERSGYAAAVARSADAPLPAAPRPALAMESGAAGDDSAYICHAQPTHSEAVREAAMAAAGKPIHV